MIIRNYIRIQKGITLIELMVVLAITSLVIASIFPVFFFGYNTYDSGRVQYDIQSNIRMASDVIRDRVRYASDLAVINLFDPSSADPNFNYIYLTDDKKSIKFKEGSQIPVEIINSSSNDTSFKLEFIKGSAIGNAIRFSNSVAAMSNLDNVLKYKIFGQSTIEDEQYQLETEIILLNTNSQIPSKTYIEGPIANPPEGEVPNGTKVDLTTDIGATIYYTTDGETPSTSSIQYEDPIEIVSNTIIKAIAVEDGISSSVAIYNYAVFPNPPPEVNNVEIIGIAELGQTLTVEYSYSSNVEPVIAQGGSIIKWYRSIDKNKSPDDNIVHSSVFIFGDNSTREYMIANNDKGYYLYVEITPKDLNNMAGLPIQSNDYFGKIKD